MRILLAALLLSAGAARADRYVELGPGRAQRDSSAASLEFPFVARADEELTGAAVRIAFAGPIGPVEVLVNDERVALLSGDDPKPPDIPVDRALLADRNTLSLRLRDREGRCVARPGAWTALQSVGMVVQAAPVPLPNELALLPLPFFDRGYDTSATVPVVLGHPPTREELRLLGLVAGWFAVDAPLPLDFRAAVGELPDSRAIVLVGSDEDARRLGIDPPRGPSIRMIDHPQHPDSNVKLLVIGGRTTAELRTAVESLAARTEPLAGPEAMLAPPRPQPPAPPYSAPRWVPSQRPVPFSKYPAGGVFAHDGNTPATLSVRFRVAPDLWIWPEEFVVLDLGYSERIPRGTPPPRLDVEMNGYFLATLPRAGSGGTERVRLRIPREHMRGFNQLLVHVHYPDPDPCAAAPSSSGEPPRVEIAGDSVLHLEGLSHFANLPDVSAFAFDGFPFTRVPDLGETAVVLPDRPTPAELSMALSVLGQLAQVTGKVGTRAVFPPPSEMPRDKDVLAIGTPEDNALVARWAPGFPISLQGKSARVQRSFRPLDLLGGLEPLLEAQRAADLLARSGDVAAIASAESPVSPGRTAVVITGTALPRFADFLGYARSRGRAGDLLLLAGGERAMFRIGGAFGRGQLDAWTRARWFLASHWLALPPVLLAGAILLGAHGRRALARRMRARLLVGEAA
ncbi:MAG TPA: cellulose biosynthesis cyclic di-GMP-binding regulatory protein BcsB [Myxococcales bacterium]|nr:cellulose biosynthesis cyclic di-GMP-binding regulatory protein BcsB [Myxococcales bacterium]